MKNAFYKIYCVFRTIVPNVQYNYPEHWVQCSTILSLFYTKYSFCLWISFLLALYSVVLTNLLAKARTTKPPSRPSARKSERPEACMMPFWISVIRTTSEFSTNASGKLLKTSLANHEEQNINPQTIAITGVPADWVCIPKKVRLVPRLHFGNIKRVGHTIVLIVIVFSLLICFWASK